MRRVGGTLLSRAAALGVCLALVGACADDNPPAKAEPKAKVVAFLRAVASVDSTFQETVLTELSAAGYRSGRNLKILGGDPAEAHPDPADAAAVVARWNAEGVDLIFALSSSGAKTAAAAAPEVKVLFLSNDPTAVGLVKDERHPDGNMTGATFRVPADRTLDLARRVLPGLDEVGLLFPPADPSALPGRDNAVTAAAALNIRIVQSPFASEQEIAPAIRSLEADGVDAILLSNSPTTSRAAAAIGAAVATSKVPVVANTKLPFALLVLEPDATVLYRQMGRQAARLLDGTKPADVPVEDPGGFRVVVNDEVALRLGVSVPEDVRREATPKK
ncbi:MAG TPA: ABC transporter substrate binding protein [Acidimicrobiales bacterium]|nr:ABC transporter substrate binding protein [Acidimicrobiales bacterium]